MAGLNDSWGNPSGRPGNDQTDRDQPGYGEPYRPPRGHAQFGSPWPGAPAGPPPASQALHKAAVLQIVQSAVWGAVGLVFVAIPGRTARVLHDAGVSSPTGDVKDIAVKLGLLLLAVSATMIVLATLMLRRSDGARRATLVLQLTFGAFWLVFAASALADGDLGGAGIGLLYLASCGAVVLLLRTRSARAATGAGSRRR